MKIKMIPKEFIFANLILNGSTGREHALGKQAISLN